MRLALWIAGREIFELSLAREAVLTDEPDEDEVAEPAEPIQAPRIGAVYGNHAADLGYAPGPARFGFWPSDDPVPEYVEDV